ncbi:lipid-binding protein [Microbotryomycetes sp. JL221]|nr:lipid-binding protein [Microbotryomycetes sp. JL221]
MTTDSGSKRSGLFSALKDGVKQFNATIQDSGSLQHTIRQQVTTFQSPSDTLKISLAIKSGSAVVSDFEALSRETTSYSKSLYLWGQESQGNDLKDVSDRLAWIEFETGRLFKNHAQRIDQARSALKDVRNYENDIVPKRKSRQALQTKLTSTKSSSDQEKLRIEIEQLDREIAPLDNQLEVLKRTKLNESFNLQFQAQRELGEKLAILAGYGELLLRTLESDGFGSQYAGQEKTARVKGQASEAVQAWSLPNSHIPTPQLREGGESYLGRSDTQSFASDVSQSGDSLHAPSPHPSVSHATSPPPSHSGGHRLAPIPISGAAAAPNAPSPPPVPARHHSFGDGSSSAAAALAGTYGTSPGGTHLNMSPTPQDLGPSYSPRQRAYPVEPTIEGGSPNMPPNPTVAETGAPIVGTGGPISGQLPNRKTSLSAGSGAVYGFSTTQQQQQEQQHLSAAQEKALLEQAQVERERTSLTGSSGLGAGGSAAVGSTSDGSAAVQDMPPSYNEGLPADPEEARARLEAEQILARERERKNAPL